MFDGTCVAYIWKLIWKSNNKDTNSNSREIMNKERTMYQHNLYLYRCWTIMVQWKLVEENTCFRFRLSNGFYQPVFSGLYKDCTTVLLIFLNVIVIYRNLHYDPTRTTSRWSFDQLFLLCLGRSPIWSILLRWASDGFGCTRSYGTSKKLNAQLLRRRRKWRRSNVVVLVIALVTFWGLVMGRSHHI